MPTKLNEVDWKPEIDKVILRYHTIGLWVAVVFDMLFFVTDYFNIHEYWQEFLIFRTAVSLVCLVTVLFHKRIHIPYEVLGFIPVLLISIQNAYMWSVMDIENFQKHAFAYIALFIGSGMFVFYRVYYSVLIVVANIVANVIFFRYNSTLTLDEILVNGGFLTGSVAVFSILLIRMRYRLTEKEIIARLMLEKSKEQLEKQKAIIEEKNTEIIDSINYAKRIQDALITPVSKLKSVLPSSFVVFLPKDIVSGDFYWATELKAVRQDITNEGLVIFAAADCTGHGVSGAFMSIIGIKILNQSIMRHDVNTPAESLSYLNDEVFNTINSNTGEDVIRDGMDIALCSINYSTLKLQYAGANNPLYIVRPLSIAGETNLSEKEKNGSVGEFSLPPIVRDDVKYELFEIKADKQPIGAYETDKFFQNHEIQLRKGDMIYLFSDGFADQFGGPKGKKFGYKQFKQLLLDIADLPVEDQQQALTTQHEAWKGTQDQLDDICVLGVRV